MIQNGPPHFEGIAGIEYHSSSHGPDVPMIQGTRIPVTVVLDNLAEGLPVQELLASYPTLTHQDVLAALQYASTVIKYLEGEYA